MDGKRFDKLTRAMALGSSRRSVLKGSLGIGGTAVVSTMVAESADARRSSGKSRPAEILCPDQVVCGTVCCDANQCNAFETGCCPAGTTACETNSTGCCAVCEDDSHQCGYDCCETAAQCCDGECCPAGMFCSDEETCVMGDPVSCTAGEDICTGNGFGTCSYSPNFPGICECRTALDGTPRCVGYFFLNDACGECSSDAECASSGAWCVSTGSSCDPCPFNTGACAARCGGG